MHCMRLAMGFAGLSFKNSFTTSCTSVDLAIAAPDFEPKSQYLFLSSRKLLVSPKGGLVWEVLDVFFVGCDLPHGWTPSTKVPKDFPSPPAQCQRTMP